MTQYSTQSKSGSTNGVDPRWWIIRKIADLSLRAKVSFFVVGAILLPLSFVTFLLLELLGTTSISVGQKALSETSGLIQQQLLQSVDAKAQIYDLTFKGMLVDLRSLGRTFVDSGVREQNLSMYYYKHPFIDRVYVVDEKLGAHAVPQGVGALGMSALAGTDAFMGRWVGPYEFNGKTFVSYLLPLQNSATTTGFVAFDIESRSFFSDIVRLDPSESSYLVVIRNSGEYLSSSDAFYKEWNITKAEKHIFHSGVASQPMVFDALSSLEKERGIFPFASTSEKVVAYASIPSFQGKLAVVSPLGELLAVEKEKAANIQHAVNTVGTQGVIYVLIIDSLIIWLTYFLFGRGVIRPIETLRAGVATLRRTNFNAEIFITSRDEIGHLGRDFNDMAHKIRDSYDELEVETQKLQESTSFLQTLVKNMPVGVILVEAESNKILLMNRVGEEILGRRFDSTKEETFYDIANFVTEKGEHYPDEDRPLYRALTTGEVCRADDVVVVTPDGRKKNLSIISMPIRDSAGTVTSAVSVYTDITEARIVERSRNEFFAVASHELRTPLTAIRGNADMILEMYADQITDANLKQMLQDIETSSVRMIGMVNDFLEVSRLEQGKVEVKKESFAVHEVIEKVVHDLKEMVHGKGLELESTVPQDLPQVLADKNRSEQVLVNLIGNAVKFTKEGKVSITVGAEEGQVIVRVSDTGIGISEKNQALLFRKFQQAGEYVLARDVSQSTGLGLYICRLMALSMGCEVALEKSELGKGSTFTFTLPRARGEQVG